MICFFIILSGFINNKCLIMLFCFLFRTNWLGLFEFFFIRKFLFFCRSFFVCFLGKVSWYYFLNMGVMFFRLSVGFGLFGIGVFFICGRVLYIVLFSMGFLCILFCLDLCFGGGNLVLNGFKLLKIICCFMVYNIFYF